MNTSIFRLLIVMLLATSINVVATGQYIEQPAFYDDFTSYNVDLMDTDSFTLRDYRRLYMTGSTPSQAELVGTWRGINKGIVTLFGYNDFIKDIQYTECGVFGDNHEVDSDPWSNNCDSTARLDFSRIQQDNDRFKVKSANCVGRFGHGTIFSYREGGNRRFAAANLLVDKVVKIDDCHLIGRVTARTLVGPVPIAYFVLERID